MPRIRLTKAQQAKIRSARKRRGFRALLRARKMRPRRALALKPHNFVERNTLENEILVAQTEGSAVGLFRTFSLNDIRQVASYSGIFVYYKIDKIVVTFRYKTGGVSAALNPNGTSLASLTNEINPMLIFKVDHNDVTSQTISEMKDSMKTRKKVLSNDKPEFSIVLKPALQQEIYKSAVTTAYAPKWGQWLPMADVTAPHYGLKAYAVGSTYANADMGKILVTYKTYFSCKNND